MFQSFAANVPERATISDFEQLDNYSLMDIFDYLYITDLFKMARINPRFADIILDHYAKKYRLHEKQIIIRMSSNGLISDLSVSSLESQSVLLAENADHALWMLRQFGHIFTNLRYDIAEFGWPNSQKIFEYTEKHCPHAEKTISISRVNPEAMANWTHSFDNTTTRVHLGLLVSDPFPLDKLFPFMKQFIMQELLGSTIQHHPHLTTSVIYSVFHEKNDRSLFELIRLNPQMTHFHTTLRKNATFVKYVNEMLPNLQKLVLYAKPDLLIVPEVVRFENVREFTFDLSDSHRHPVLGQSIRNIHFDQLEKLKIMAGPDEIATNIREMMLANRQLKQLETNLPMTYQQLVDLLAALPELRTISLYWYAGLQKQMNLLGQLLSGNHELNRINLHQCQLNVEDFKEITPLNWQVAPSDTEHNSFVFIRKN